tara:strand:+ start:275 stop:658 length:384 start_codon:yes stop_codon:yes gene_type:complete
LATLPHTNQKNVSTSQVTGHQNIAKPVLAKFEPQIASSAENTQKAATSPENSLDAKMFIYLKESGNNPSAINKSSGACGLGQALPCSKMPCSLTDYNCQDHFFTAYMQNRYGTWENAKAFWLSHNWW